MFTRLIVKIAFVSFLMLFAVVLESQSKGTLILVPGTVNSLLGDYFHSDIIRLFQTEGWEVRVVDQLSPFGGYRTNGVIVAAAIDKNCNPQGTWIVGHSAGGLYALAGIHRSQCHVSGLVTIGAPLLGVEMVPKIRARRWGFMLKWMLRHLWFDTSVLDDYEPAAMKEFIKTISPMSYVFPWFTFAGRQTPTTTMSTWFDATRIHPLFRVFQPFIEGESDGIVEVRSASGEGLVLPTVKGKLIRPEFQTPIALDHLEQFWGGFLMNIFFSHKLEVRANQKMFYLSVSKLMASRL